MSLNYIPMSTPDVASIRKEILVNIEDPIQNRSLLDPDVDGNEEIINNDDRGERLMDPDAQDYTGADIYRAKMMAETHYMDPSDLYYNNSHDITNLSSGDNNPSLFGKEESTDQESLLDTDNDDFNYVPKEVYGAISYPSDHDEYYNESAMKAAERNALDDSEFGLPRLRKYPLNDKKHVKFAIRMFGHCKDPKDRAELAKRIFAKVKEFDMDVKIGKGNPLYEYAPKSLQESFATLSAEVPGIVSEEQFDKGTEKERQIRNLQIAARTANVLNFQPALGKAIANLKEYSFLEYFYPDVKSTAFSIRLLTCLGGLATNDMIWKLYGLRPPLCVDDTQPLTHPNKLSPEEFEDKVIPWFRKQANWYHEGKAEDSIHIEYCLSLYSVLGMILLNPEFNMDSLDDYWMGVLTDWLNHVQSEYDELSATVNSASEFYHRQYLYDLCWNPTENPMDEAIVTRNIINFASTMISQKMKIDLNESILFNTSDIYYNKDKFVSGETNLCFITGHSGSGKSTMGREIHDKNNKIDHYELDDLLFVKDHFTMSQLKEYGDLIYSYFNGRGKKFYTTCNELKENNVPASEYEDVLYVDFVHYAMDYAKSHKNNKIVIEGIWLYCGNFDSEKGWFDPSEFKDYAFYIKGTSMIISKIRAVKRDTENIKKNKIFIAASEFSKYWKWYLLNEKRISVFRKYFSDLEKKNKINEAGGDLLNKDKCNTYIINQLDPEVVDNIYLLPDKMEYPILNQDSIRMAMDMIREVDETDRAKYARMLNKKYKEFGCTFSISIDHPYAEYADQNIIDHMTRVLSEGDTVVDDQGTSDAGPSPDQAPWYVRSDVNGNVGQNLLQNKELGPNDKKNVNLTIDSTEPIIN